MSITWQVQPSKRFSATMTVAGDKSISHRAIMFGALADGITEIDGFLEGEDCLATMRAFQKMGVKIEHHGNGKVTVYGNGLHGLKAPAEALDLGNSGTSMRLMAGILAGQNFSTTLIGDKSLMKRPMKRVTVPLSEMGATITTTEAGTAPLNITGSALKAISYTLPVVSAQLKSCLLLAGLYAEGTTEITEIGISRDHSERMLKGFGVKIDKDGNTLKIKGGQKLTAQKISVPADISSASFFIVGALLAEAGEITLTNIGINPTRSAIIEILKMMGGKIEIFNQREAGGEPVADLKISASQLKGIEFPQELIPIAIDEMPILFIAAACAEGVTTAKNLHELRVKESDRLGVMAKNLSALGVKNEVVNDDIQIFGHPKSAFNGGTVDSVGDHRIAMSFAIAGLRASAPITILDCENVATSFPTFFQLARDAGLDLNHA